MSLAFVHDTLGQRVRFATGGAAEALAAEVEAVGAHRVVVLAAPAEAELAARVTRGLPVVRVHDEVVMHVPVAVAQRARAVVEEVGGDLLVSIGGGSATGLAKAVALTSGLPVVAVPTTYAGSEATDVWGLTDDGRKTTGSDPRVLPRCVVYDATLTTSLPVDLSVASGLNALAHCVDSLWAPRADPINAALAAEGARVLARALPTVVEDGDDLTGREQALYGAYLAAVAFASAGSGLHHKICHVLGGLHDLPHAATHAIVLPHVLALNAPAAPEAEARLAAAFGSPTALAGLAALRRRVGAPRSLRDLGFDAAQVPATVEAVLDVVPPSNPTTITRPVLERLLADALEGAEPS